MRIEQYANGQMNKLPARTRKIGNVSLPDFNDFSYGTKTPPVMNDDKFKEAIIEQVKKDYAVGKCQNTVESRRLQKQYVSVASPDRKGFITEGLTQIAKKPPSKNINYLDLLLFGKITYEKGVDNLSYAEFNDGNGDHVATYSNGEWLFYGTKAEFSRESEFNSIYSEAWRNAEKSAKNPIK